MCGGVISGVYGIILGVRRQRDVRVGEPDTCPFLGYVVLFRKVTFSSRSFLKGRFCSFNGVS